MSRPKKVCKMKLEPSSWFVATGRIFTAHSSKTILMKRKGKIFSIFDRDISNCKATKRIRTSENLLKCYRSEPGAR